jgi:hypothetical protein
MTWRRPSISPADSSSALVPSSALPSGFFICVTLTRHSIGFFCGRTIAPWRGNFTPRRSASSISAGMVVQASPAAAGSTPFNRNIMVG